MNAKSIRLTMTTGFALFAMFFGAGNLVFPLQIGVTSGQEVNYALIAFLISGVGVPFLGLFAVSLYEGDYWKFFKNIGKVPAFLIITFLVLILGPLFVVPRTEIVTYHTLMPFLPAPLNNAYLFNFFYFAIILILTLNQMRVVDIIGGLLSPLKLIAFFTLITAALYTASPLLHVTPSASDTFKSSLITGYGTMDLLAALFFCTVAYHNIVLKCKKLGITSSRKITQMTLISCVIGAVLISLVYTGFVFSAAAHAAALQHVPTESLISKLSELVLGEYGSLFVSLCVFIACVATGAALTEVSSSYFQRIIFRNKIPRMPCLLLVLVIMYAMAILGFGTIMKIAFPILEVLYPLLIILCVVNIGLKLKNQKREDVSDEKLTEK